jgi:hypothetical protein
MRCRAVPTSPTGRVSVVPRQEDDMKRLDDMTLEEKVESMSARLDEIAGVVIELEKQIKGLQAEIARQKGGTGRPVLKLG